MNNLEEFTRLCASRFSCRSYTSDPVPEAVLQSILQCVRLAPSACNRQPWQFVIIDTPQMRSAILEAYPRQWLENVPLFIVACGVHSQAWHRPDGKDHTDVDVAIAVEHICLAAGAAGLGTCWICNFDRAVLARAINAPDDIEPIAIIPIGYPAMAEPEKTRKSISEITRCGKF
ncbi:MAG: nitroreductase family protein [Paramuribaculum sp.]|nr:nitroreductase family protein [Paramuribaculum sp.]